MPARVTRLAAPIAAINLTVKPLNTIIIPQVKALAVVLVLDLELSSTVSVELGLGTHALGLAGGEVAGEHAAVASAGEFDPLIGSIQRAWGTKVRVKHPYLTSRGGFNSTFERHWYRSEGHEIPIVPMYDVYQAVNSLDSCGVRTRKFEFL